MQGTLCQAVQQPRPNVSVLLQADTDPQHIAVAELSRGGASQPLTVEIGLLEGSEVPGLSQLLEGNSTNGADGSASLGERPLLL